MHQDVRFETGQNAKRKQTDEMQTEAIEVGMLLGEW